LLVERPNELLGQPDGNHAIMTRRGTATTALLDQCLLHKIYVLQKTSTGNNFCRTEKRAGNFALLPPPPSELARQGRASAARRIESDPAQLGAYAGKTGLFVGAAAREERANAQRVAESIGPGSPDSERRRVQARAIIARTSSGNCRRMRPGRQSFRSARRRRSAW
jgi:hypothetical protein